MILILIDRLLINRLLINGLLVHRLLIDYRLRLIISVAILVIVRLVALTIPARMSRGRSGDKGNGENHRESGAGRGHANDVID